jgi:hypothetical protein
VRHLVFFGVTHNRCPQRAGVQLILTGEQALTDATEKRLQAIASTSGMFPEAFPPGYLDDLRQDWPE